MTPTELRITNFRGVKGTQTFVFPRQPGLYFMQGTNQVEPRLGSNGSGKSTIWQALFWLGYNKTPDGLKAGEVCNWDLGKGTCVELDYLTAYGYPRTLTRTWGPISWTLTDHEMARVFDLSKDQDDLLATDLRLGFLPFLYAVYMAQERPMFLDLKADAQASLFSEIMGLEKWVDYSGKASRMASTQDAVCRRLEREVAELEGKLSVDQDFSQQEQDFEASRKDQIKKLDSEYHGLLDFLRRAKQHLEESGEACRVISQKAPGYDAQSKKADDAHREGKDLLVSVRDVYRVAESLVKANEAQIKFLQDHEHCPTCDLDLDPATKRAAIETKQQEQADATRYMAKADKELAEVESSVRQLGDLADRAHDRLTKLLDQLKEAQQINRTDGLNAQRMEKDLDDMEDQLGELEAKVNPYKDLQRVAQEATRTAQEALNTARARLDAAQEKYSLYGFWVRGFKDLRLQEIATALVELEIEVNSSAVALGLIGWELRFEVDRETKGGSVQRGFSVGVLSPHNSKIVPWESWSGGEKQRLRLATNMGLSNLIRSRTGLQLPLEIWDEASKGLSPEGVKDLLSCLTHRAITDQRAIWIVDHTSHGYGGFSGHVMITKTRAGTTIGPVDGI